MYYFIFGFWTTSNLLVELFGTPTLIMVVFFSPIQTMYMYSQPTVNASRFIHHDDRGGLNFEVLYQFLSGQPM